MAEALWKPKQTGKTHLEQWQSFLKKKNSYHWNTYQEVHEWSIRNREEFWQSVWDYGKVIASKEADIVLSHGNDMLESKWFEGARLNYAENLLRNQTDRKAIQFRNELGHEKQITFSQLRFEVQRIASSMKKMGIQTGDCVAGFLPNIIETVIAMLATTSIGAIWSSTSPDFGLQGVLDRFGQIEPKLLFVADGYYYKGKPIDCKERIVGLVEKIPSIQKVVICNYISESPDSFEIPKSTTFYDFLDTEPLPLEFEQLPFDHPLFIMYSSGTTGIPKCIVHGAGGTLLQHIKEHQLHCNLQPYDSFFYFTTCGWMMWNWLVTGLASEATLQLFDGNPFYPTPEVLWQYASEHEFSVFGTSAKYLSALEKEGFSPKKAVNLPSLKTILSTGSPLSASSFDFVYEEIKTDVHLASICGGTDIISCFMLGVPTLPVYREEIQAKGLGMDVRAFSETGQSVENEKGELVCVQSFPSQPVCFWKDPEKEKYKQAYFSHYSNIWRHGDYIQITKQHGIVVYGRSDATLNPGGVRIGTAEIYRAIEPLPELMDSLVVGIPNEDDVDVVLFVKMQEGFAFNDELKKKLVATIRQQTTPRHVPAKIIETPDIPYTLSGKKVELAVKQLLTGHVVENKDALANPQSLEFFRQLQL